MHSGAERVLRYEGKAKRVYRTGTPGECVIEFTDAATAFNGERKGEISDKGRINCATTSIFMAMLEEHGVPTHVIRQLSETELLARDVEIVPLEVVVRNIAAGSFTRRLGVPEGTPLSRPIVEFSYKRDDLGDPLLTRSHIEVLDLAPADVVAELEVRALRINELLRSHMVDRGVTLVDFKLEFGHTADGELVLADEISPDTCRFWDTATGDKLDKDLFRHDLGDATPAYQLLLDRLGATGVPA
ncbi:MAG: phosphoribosylaminoimidazolesuccinocarboxamide synthase [Thermoleophilia bacterium]|nr:phosphoribosylaminoimidazolesuccinocarboxamide synthase [Thermoleophilia bacterium]